MKDRSHAKSGVCNQPQKSGCLVALLADKLLYSWKFSRDSYSWKFSRDSYFKIFVVQTKSMNLKYFESITQILSIAKVLP